MGSYGKKKRPAGAARAVMSAMKKPAPPGYHRMPDGKLMKGSTHGAGKKR